jgi:hypothetical protein
MLRARVEIRRSVALVDCNKAMFNGFLTRRPINPTSLTWPKHYDLALAPVVVNVAGAIKTLLLTLGKVAPKPKRSPNSTDFE